MNTVANPLALRPPFAWALIGLLVAAFFAFFLSFQAGVFALLFLVIGWWVWQNPEESFLLLLVTMPILPMLKITQTIGTATLVKDVIILTLATRVFFYPLLTQTLPYRRFLVWAPLALLAVWTGLEMLRADSLILGVLRARDIALYAVAYVAILYLPHSKKIIRRRFWWGTAAFFIVLLLGIFQWFFAVDSAVLRFDPVRAVWIPRISSVLAHPSIFGQYAISGATLFTAIGLAGATVRRRILGFGLALVTLPFIALTYSRAVWIGIAAALGVMIGAYLLYWFGQKINRTTWWRITALLGAGGILVAVLVLQFTPAATYIRSYIDPTYGSNLERLDFLARLIAPMSNNEALFGLGLGDVTAQNFREITLETYDIAAGSARAVQLTKNTTLVDNQYLKTFVEMGLTGLLIYAWLFWRLFRESWRTARHTDFLARTIGLWSLGFFTAFIVQAFFIDIWDIFPTNLLFWIVAALLCTQLTPTAAKAAQ